MRHTTIQAPSIASAEAFGAVRAALNQFIDFTLSSVSHPALGLVFRGHSTDITLHSLAWDDVNFVPSNAP